MEVRMQYEEITLKMGRQNPSISNNRCFSGGFSSSKTQHKKHTLLSGSWVLPNTLYSIQTIHRFLLFWILLSHFIASLNISMFSEQEVQICNLIKSIGCGNQQEKEILIDLYRIHLDSLLFFFNDNYFSLYLFSWI